MSINNQYTLGIDIGSTTVKIAILDEEQEGAEAVVPDLIDFFLYCFYNNNFKADELGMSKKTKLISNIGIKLMLSTANKNLK